ncbi:COX15/CtaA family protein [Candidatus Nitrososphaera evergladensis]|uniref:COX15/CtaA family protein n=1 Tax=Candidatus Nitrososphaera evergladensis TaxID=1459637 RepID=UPI0011E5B8FD|nr:COX15/CtaA family protein [Candidatus Nitrososphaera evergladensis]
MTEKKTAAAEEPRLKRSIIVISFISLGLVYSVMLIGVFLSSGPITENGLACTDWPLCPNGLFGAPEGRYFIEYVHRLVAAVTAGFVYATAIIVPSSIRRAKMAAVIAAAIVSWQLALGFITVTTHLHPIAVASHLSTGISVFAFALLTFLWVGIWRKHGR